MSERSASNKYSNWIAGLFIILIIVDIAVIGWRKYQTPAISESCSEKKFVFRFDPNLASVEEMECLPGLSHKLAEEIVAYRQEYISRYPGRKAYRTREDLLQVKGISEKKLTQAQQFLIFPEEKSSDE
jgi:DNA uptake protein ComE-like DNA-binding protein